MKFIITDKRKKDTFIAVFHMLKNLTTSIHLILDAQKGMYIQGIDSSQTSLFEVCILPTWFQEFQCIITSPLHLCIDVHTFYLVLSTKMDNVNWIFTHNKNVNEDVMFIEFICTTTQALVRKFKLNLKEEDYDPLLLQEFESEVDFIISSKKMCEIMNELHTFGEDVCIECSQEKVMFTTSNDSCEVNVHTDEQEMVEYAVNENLELLKVQFGLKRLKQCLSNKLSTNVVLSVNSQTPTKIKYNLDEDVEEKSGEKGEKKEGEKENYLLFYISPKIINN